MPFREAYLASCNIVVYFYQLLANLQSMGSLQHFPSSREKDKKFLNRNFYTSCFALQIIRWFLKCFQGCVSNFLSIPRSFPQIWIMSNERVIFISLFDFQPCYRLHLHGVFSVKYIFF